MKTTMNFAELYAMKEAGVKVYINHGFLLPTLIQDTQTVEGAFEVTTDITLHNSDRIVEAQLASIN